MSSSFPDKKETNVDELFRDSGPSVSYSEHSLSSIASHDECFRSRNHAEVSLNRMHSFFLKNQLTDVILVAGRRRISAHKLVLSAGSEYFAAMFNSDLRESTQQEIVLQDVDGDALSDLIYYCYTGKIELREDSVETLLGTACLLRLCEVVDACCIFLKRQLHPSNAIGIYLYADSQGCIDLRNAAMAYTAKHFMEVMKNQEYLMLPAKEVAKLLSCEDLNVPNEEEIFNGLMLWVNHDRDSRKSDIGHLLSVVKIPLLSPMFIADFVDAEPIVKDDLHCQNLIMEALKYHLLPERREALQSSRTKPRKSTIGHLYAVGGVELKKAGATSIEEYDPREDKWRQVEVMPGRRLQFGVAVIGSRVHVVGGRDGLKTLNTVERWERCCGNGGGGWTSIDPMGTHRHGLGVATLPGGEGPLYAVGGHDGWSFLNTVERWDPVSGRWSYVSSMLTQRSTVGVAVLNDRLYAVGGRDGCSCLKTVECYDPYIDRWTTCASMSKRRGGVGVGVMNGCIYALGGHDVPCTNPSTTRADCVERYDPRTDAWTTVASMSIGRDAIGVELLGDRLVTVGGYDGQSYLRIVEAYDARANQWTQLAPLNTGRAGSCVVMVNPPYA